jgi:hypothetical protein
LFEGRVSCFTESEPNSDDELAVEAKNLAESMVYTAEKALKDNGDKVPAEIKKDVEEKIAAVKSVKEGTDVDAIKKFLATEKITMKLQFGGSGLSMEADGFVMAPTISFSATDSTKYTFKVHTEAKEFS